MPRKSNAYRRFPKSYTADKSYRVKLKWSKVQCWGFPRVFPEGAIFVYKQLSFPECAKILWNTELFFRESVCSELFFRRESVCVEYKSYRSWRYVSVCMLLHRNSECDRSSLYNYRVLYAVKRIFDETVWDNVTVKNELSCQLWFE